MATDSRIAQLNRRQVLAGTAAALAAGGMPRIAEAAPKFRRYEITDPAIPPNVIPSFKKAVEAMLKLPPTDPRNWYRWALIHIFDCPHGNWWFLPWHRGYLGWFERICRDLSGDPAFALPYWDWTKKPSIPMVMFDDWLDPTDKFFLPGIAAFEKAFKQPLDSIWKSFTPAQLAVLAKRDLTTATDFWDEVSSTFPIPADARELVAANDPDLGAQSANATKIEVIRSALKNSTFAGVQNVTMTLGFASGKATDHSDSAGEGILENQPHDQVHGGISGFMGLLLSPIDPIFYLHHANIDRLWDVWTRRQIAIGRPTLPKGADLAAWAADPFLFFCDEKRNPLPNAKAGDYALMTPFDYHYTRGSGEEMVPAVVASVPKVAPSGVTLEAKILAPSLAGMAEATALVEFPAGLRGAAEPDADPRTVQITLDLAAADRGRKFTVLLGRTRGQSQVRLGSIFIFGHAHGPTIYELPLLDSAVAALGAIEGATVLEIRVVPQPDSRPQSPRLHDTHGGAARRPRLLAVRLNL